jgi:histidine ammonia-lyase
MPQQFNYGKDSLTVGKAIALASGKLKGSLNDETIRRVKASEDNVQQIVKNNKTVYGINTVSAYWQILRFRRKTLRHSNIKFFKVIV